jgi:hypothetical protein
MEGATVSRQTPEGFSSRARDESVRGRRACELIPE